MITSKHYVPILKGKRGEFGALRHLTQEQKRFITPLIDVPRISGMAKGNINIDDRCRKIAAHIKNDWGITFPIFIDLTDIHPDVRTIHGEHPMEFIFREFRTAGINAIPVTGFDRDKAYNKSVLKISKEDNRGACVRVLIEDTDNIAELNVGLTNLINELELNHKKIHLLIDFKDIQKQDLSKIEARIFSIINGLQWILDWHSLILVSSNFPENLSSIKRDSIEAIERREYLVWRSLIKNANKLKRLPSYGDYGVVHPVGIDHDPRTINPSAKIRYTLEDKWLIVKGHSLKIGNKFKQYHDLADLLSKESKYRGGNFSWGDEYIAKCARRAAKSGNLETWIKVDTNHHLTFVSEQISRISFP